MRDLLRLVTIALLSFVVVGGTMLYSSDTDVFASVRSFIAGTSATPADGRPEDAVPLAANRLWLPRPYQDRWVGLAGFPDAALLNFALPHSITIASAELNLNFEAQLANGGDGRLSIAVNGTPKGEVVLNDGRERHEVVIGLDRQDLAARTIQVELSSRGTTSSGQICPADTTNSGVAINLTPDSGLALYTNDPLDSAELRAIALADPVTINLGTSVESQAAALKLAHDINTGISTRFVAEPLAADIVPTLTGITPLDLVGNHRLVVAANGGGQSLLEVRGIAPDRLPVADRWPVAVETLGTEVLARNFRVTRRWAIDYKLVDLPRGHMPRRLDLAMQLSDLAEGGDWSLRVLLNGQLLISDRIAEPAREISLPVALPMDLQGLSNQITVELVDNSANDSVCRTGRLVEAQLLPETGLRDLGAQPADGWGKIVHDLARAGTIGLTVATPVNPEQAAAVSGLLELILPANAALELDPETAAITPAEIRIVTAASFSDGTVGPAGGQNTAYVALAKPAAGSDPLVVALASAAGRRAIETIQEGETGLMIRFAAP